METSSSACTDCGKKKPISEFTRIRTTGKMKQFRTCNSCYIRKSKPPKNTKKRQLEINENEDQDNEGQETENDENEDQENNDLEIIDPTNLYDHFTQLLNTYLMQPNDDSGNVLPFQFQCGIDISTFDGSEKEVVNELVELIEGVDEFSWIAVMSRLASNKETRSSTFNPLSEFGTRFPFEESTKEHKEFHIELVWDLIKFANNTDSV
ncbi:19585_t:CDS:2 [Cetraspora pellucida]|uniref:19585_t:CDS:1 n=1 Tax=Cetraspora pellucida TaxID=1433469 RepID=A0A9N9HJZ3_9GLOM|nr:19585_t:CDS:2 [Cetraspora pellucida]